MTDTKILVLGRSSVVHAAAAILADHGFPAVGVNSDDETIAELGTGRYTVLVLGTGVEAVSRERLIVRAAAHGTLVLEARRSPGQGVLDNVRDFVVPEVRRMLGQR
ncbi:hypothetical protein [Nocardia aurantia]|uniref:Uncharacterized protein n=1 Tax=Nocardia aurantia TaxID=2585199 RepID=A0A7K0DLZ7_9NOCA|nr:hypothetical protein [Nocardia aurantia]MQY26785.1 hypothetical protein [Nocardia aurantia]